MAGVADGGFVSRGPRARGPRRTPTAVWNRYEWIVWSEDGPDYRLRIRVDREGQCTGIIEGVESEWMSGPEDQCQERLSSPWVKLTPWVTRGLAPVLRALLPDGQPSRAPEAWSADTLR